MTQTVRQKENLKYLTTPCPRPTCGKMMLNQPVKHGAVYLCFCSGCGKNARYSIRDHADGSQGYEVSVYGGDAPESVVKSFRAHPDIADTLVAEAKAKAFAYRWKDKK